MLITPRRREQMEIETGTSATSRRCLIRKPVGPAAQALGKDQRTEMEVANEQEEQGEDSWDV